MGREVRESGGEREADCGAIIAMLAGKKMNAAENSAAF
jgi:hypothetical protein